MLRETCWKGPKGWWWERRKENYTDVPAARVWMFRSLQLRELANEGEFGANQVIMLATACT
jgi:hypothetical protein